MFKFVMLWQAIHKSSPGKICL